MQVRVKKEEFSYKELKEMHNHAKLYDGTSDKKDFLRNISAYEQKIVLLESKKPYEVLLNLESLDLEKTHLILETLTDQEIKEVLILFSQENKKAFYKNFSDLKLVNQFIINDRNSPEYIENLSFDRKVDLIQSSTTATVVATSKVYDSMSDQEKEMANNTVTSGGGVSALNSADSSQSSTDTEVKEEEIVKEVENKIEKLEITEKEEKLEDKKAVLYEQKNAFFKHRLKFYIENVAEFALFDIKGDVDYNLLSEELKDIVDKDFNIYLENKKEKHEDHKLENKQEKSEELNSLEEFGHLKQKCEEAIIEEIKNELNNNLTDIEETNEEVNAPEFIELQKTI